MIEKYRQSLASLTFYRNLLNDPVIAALVKLLEALGSGPKPRIHQLECLHQFCYEVYRTGRCLKCHVKRLILEDDNWFSRISECKPEDALTMDVIRMAARDLYFLQGISGLEVEDLAGMLDATASLPQQCNTGCGQEDMDPIQNASEWSREVLPLAEYYRAHSRGLFGRYQALRWESQTGLHGVSDPHLPDLAELVGYQSQKEQLIQNTVSFLNGLPANNVLLYGSRGTGKSTMIKAMLARYHRRGLRMIGISRDNLKSLHLLTGLLQDYSPRFILFIDDLSFEDYETEYKELKAIMEGGLEKQPDNVLIYATSNRRHLVREYHGDRNDYDEEIHSFDTHQEKLSLADRFGLTITFPSPSRQQYLEMVESLIKSSGLDIDLELMRRKALEWERARHGPSGRTARQFVDYLCGRSREW